MRGQKSELRRVSPGDVPSLLTILREPEVAVHWSEPDDELDRRELLGADASEQEPCTTYCIVVNGAVVGWIAAWENLHRDYRHAGVDVFVSAKHQGRGYGTEAIFLVCRWLFEERGHHRITIDPAATNSRAIRAYEKVGFKRVGVLRQYERGAQGEYHDGLLLDLLPTELKEP